MRKLLINITMLLALVLSGLLVYTLSGPYRAIKGIDRALVEQNTRILDRYVDFPILRGNLKRQLDVYLVRQIGAEGSGFWGSMMLTAVGNVTEFGVDMLVTPNGIAAILQGRSTWQYHIAKLSGRPVSGASHESSSDAFHLLRDTERRFESVSRFTATAHHDDGTNTIFIFERQGLKWKLTDIRLPMIES